MSYPLRPAKLGIMLPLMDKGTGLRRWSELREMVVCAEEIGFDSIWAADHLLYKLADDSPPKGCYEVWSILCAIAACTRRVELGTLVIGMGFRNPALLAKMADTLEEISQGRLILGIGAGYHQFEYDAFGYPFDYKYSRFEEGLKILHGLLRDGKVDFEGRFSSAKSCELKPRGPRPNGPPLMIGSKSPKMLNLMARYADSWNAFWEHVQNRPAGYARIKPILDQACEAVGRDPATLGRTVTLLVADASSELWWKSMPFSEDVGQIEPLQGDPEDIADTLKAFADLGIDHIQLQLDSCTVANIEKLGRVLEALQ